MKTILEAIKAKDETAEGQTIAKALGGTTIAQAIAGESSDADTEPDTEPDAEPDTEGQE